MQLQLGAKRNKNYACRKKLYRYQKKLRKEKMTEEEKRIGSNMAYLNGGAILVNFIIIALLIIVLKPRLSNSFKTVESYFW